MSSKATQFRAPTGSYPKLWRLLDHYFLKEDVPDRTALMAIDTIVALNQAVLDHPKSVNNRAIRSSEPEIRNLVNVGGTEILTEVGWRFKVMRMEECWVLPYDADLEALKTAQEKIIETQEKLRVRLTASSTAGKLEKDKAEKLLIMRQIEQDKIEREERHAIRSGAPLKPTQSLDEMRRQAIKERMERDKARKAQQAAELAAATPPTPLPGTFPPALAEHSRLEDNYYDDHDDEEQDERGFIPGLHGELSTGRSPHQRQQTRKSRRTAPTPIQVKKPVVKERYIATENKLGGSSREDQAEHEEDDRHRTSPDAGDLNSPC